MPYRSILAHVRRPPQLLLPWLKRSRLQLRWRHRPWPWIPHRPTCSKVGRDTERVDSNSTSSTMAYRPAVALLSSTAAVAPDSIAVCSWSMLLQHLCAFVLQPISSQSSCDCLHYTRASSTTPSRPTACLPVVPHADAVCPLCLLFLSRHDGPNWCLCRHVRFL